MAANAPPEDAVWSRRRMLGAATGAGIGILALQAETAIAQFSFASHVDGELHPLAPGVFAWLQHVPPGESGFAVANCGLVATGNKLVAIDATASPVQARQFMAAAVKATGKDFGRVVLTHSHGDHVHGLAMFGPVEVIAQENCRTAMLAGASTTKPGGWQPRRGWARGDEVFRNILPNVTYTERMRFYEGDSAVELLWPGRGHTSGDTVVILPRQRIAFIGDIGFFGLTPLMGDGYCGDWIAACERILAMDIDVLVPGHGPIGGKAELAAMRDYLVLLRAAARTQFDRGVSAGIAAATIDLGPFARLPEADRVVDNVVRLYADFSGTMTAGRDVAAIARARRDYELARAGKP